VERTGGVFEFPRFAVGTNAIARAVAANARPRQSSAAAIQ